MPADPLPPTLLQDRLPDWWRTLALNLDGDHLDLRRQGIEALRNELSLPEIVDMVAYAHGDDEAGERVIGVVRATARSADGAFAGDVGDSEPPALVAAAIADQLAVHPGSELSTATSLLVLSAAYSGCRPSIQGIGLPDYAARQLEHAAASARRTPALVMLPTTRKMVTDALENLAGVPSTGAAVTDTVLGTALSDYNEILTKLAARVDELATRSAKEHGVLREQLRQQTWVLESWCETAEAPWGEVDHDARVLIAAVELADRTNGNAPAVDAESLLGSVLIAAGSSGKVSPLSSVGAAAPLIQDHLTTAPNAMLFPVSTALARWREREGGAGWKAAAKGILPTRQQPALELSLQVYRETLALRVLGDD